MNESVPVGRIELRQEGSGEISNEVIYQRARELALQEGRDKVTDDYLARAAAELARPTLHSTPTDAAIDTVDGPHPPDEPPGSSGRQAPRILPQDEASIAETLVEEGVVEAEHDLMTEAERAARRANS